ncbi:MAG TPA: rhomboid family intramembrane serine protease [Nevskia sp.]|nr:rhomboid family intramembrane serine protease [Nevskia sp.]
MQPLLIHGKRSRYLTLVAMAVGFIGTGVLLGIQGGGLRLYGWLLVVVQCLSLPNLVRLALLKGPRLVIDDDGIHDHLLRVGTIPWSEIVGAKMRTVNSFCFIALELREPELWLRRMSPLRRWLMSRNRSAGFGMLSLNLNATDGDPVQVLRLIQQRCGESASHPAASSSPPPLPPADIRIPIRYSRRFSLSISANNSFGLSGPGEIEFLDGRVLLRGLRNRFFGLGRWFSYDFHRTATTNLMHSGRMLHFDIEPPGAPPQVVTIWTKDEDTARRIASALPSRASEGMSLVASEIHKFQRRVETTGGRAWITPALIAINIVVFIAAASRGAGVMEPKPDVLVSWGTNIARYTMDGQWWRLITAMFLHFGLLHLLLNMWALAVSGRFTERLYGGPLYLLIYLTSGLCGNLASVLWNSHVNSAGASGAIFGVYGALLAFFMRKDTRVPAPIVKQQRSSGFLFIIINLMYSLGQHGIDNAAHAGGLLSGLLLGFVLARPLESPQRSAALSRHTGLGVGLAVVLLAGLGLGARYKAATIIPEIRFQEDVAWLDDERYKARELFAEAKDDARNGKLSNEAFADSIERGPLQIYEAMQRKIQSDTLPAHSEYNGERRAYAALIQNSLDGCRLYAQGLRQHDASAIKQGEDRFEQSLQSSRWLELFQEDGQK